ncbi:geranyl diphosphate synthase [Chrysochromulina tobinii]|uniref:Geranyl diphosphate synthase n=1 Tax=Chrysochromulina tobinii TaxID=1460289 RepID=A0A0M0JNF8_9EUKA|nr:geranyl diphosphate synthase [Chrysochromulina tobinii]|eukprot:KOO27798.1 geranyl diphosphate synthase [Chrysochromulina sp. CCMP291]
MVFGQVVIGPPGSGKTTYCNGMRQFLEGLGRKVAVVNLDPANDVLPCAVEADIRDLISLEGAAAACELGPNGALVYCIEFLEANLDWLIDALERLKDCYVLIDMPGQVELYTHHDSVQLELPQINLLSKVDLIESYGELAFGLDFYTDVLDPSRLLPLLQEREGDTPFARKHAKLNAAIAELVDDFSLVAFGTLNITDKQSMARALKSIDKANGYCFGVVDDPNIFSTVAAGETEWDDERVGRFTRRSSASRVAVADKDREPVVVDSTTMTTVRSLNEKSLSKFRCHSISKDPSPDVNPFGMVAAELSTLNGEVCAQLEGKDDDLVGSAQHFFGAGNTREGKRVRPVIVCLMGQAASLAAGLSEEQAAAAYVKHRELAAITEMIHTASLVHDDVLDGADTRRGGSAVHKLFTTKAAVLSGDFLLARASIALAKLAHPQVVKEMAKSLEALVQGEIMQLQSTEEERLSLEYYLTKSYCKTASLMAFSCKSAALLASHPLESSTVVAAEKFGYHFGLAFQVIDDLLDFTGTSDTLGKPGLQDMALGLSTAPVLYGIEEQPELKELVARKFGQPGDVHRACELVLASKGLQRTKELANFHAQAAVDACCSLPVSKQRDGLIQLCHVVLSRSS